MEWSKMAADATDTQKAQSMTEVLPSGDDRLAAALEPFFRYINILIESEVYGT